MKVGDTVRFLNDVGGGTIRGFKDKDIVLVEDNDGFEIPVLMRECVVINSAHDIEIEQGDSEINIASIGNHQNNEEDKADSVETKEGEMLNLQLAFIAKDPRNISTTNYSCYIVNDSNYYISFSFLSYKEGVWELLNLDTVEPNFKLYLRDISKEELNVIELSCIQYFAYKKNKGFELKDAETVEMRIDTVKFYKLHSFKDSIYFDEPAILCPIIEEHKAEGLQISAEEIEQAMQSKDKLAEKRKRIEKKKKKADILEIDLHIHELIDNTAGITPSEILEIQMKEFHETMNENRNKKGTKLVFIHGKGNGILKNEIAKALTNSYRSVYFQDASFQEYGFGATMITIK